MSRLENKWVLITGASSGFGAAAARLFAAEKAKLILGARRVERLKKVAAECREAGSPEVHFHALDVSTTKNVEKFFTFVNKKSGNRKSKIENSLDVLVNNAGGAH